MANRYVLRPYQQAAVDAGLAYVQDPALNGRNGIIVQPTGSGKSLTIANICERLDGPSVVLQPSKEILAQNAEKLASYGRKAAIFSASFGRREIGQITLATIGSVVRYAEAFRDARYVLIDECHAALSPKGGMYLDFLDCLPTARILGLTATPFRLASNSFGSELRFLTRTRPRVFHDVVHVTQVADLVAGGYLARLDYRVRPKIRREKLTLNTTGADYTDASVQRHFAEVGFVGAVYDEVRALLDEGRRHVLVFTRFVEESRRLVQALPCVAIVTAETPPAVRDEIVRNFRAGRIRCVTNVNVLSIGFDFPALDAVVLARPSVSLALYYQQIGRGVRPHPGKADAAIVDLVGLVDQFGPIEDLTIVPGGYQGQQWTVRSKDRQLTNTYFHVRDGTDPVDVAKAQRTRQYWAKRMRRRA